MMAMAMAKSTPFAFTPLHLRSRLQQQQHHHNANFPQFKYLAPSPHNPFFLLNVSPSSQFRPFFAFPRQRPNFAIKALDSDAANQVPLPLHILLFIAFLIYSLTLSIV